MGHERSVHRYIETVECFGNVISLLMEVTNASILARAED
jgi:hypothetical protein